MRASDTERIVLAYSQTETDSFLKNNSRGAQELWTEAQGTLRVLDILNLLILLVLITLLAAGLYALWQNVPINHEYEAFVANVSSRLPQQSTQFYPNMRYQHRIITYNVSDECTAVKKEFIAQALATLESSTILRFALLQTGTAELSYLCSARAPDAEDKRHFVAGEGGPTRIINTTRYAVILSGKVLLYRSEKCDRPIIALHETLHALGFDHTSDKKSIMFPVTDCSQEIDPLITTTLTELYSAEVAPDLVIERVSANVTGRYLAFEIAIANYGLASTANATLFISTPERMLQTFPLEDIEFGQRKTLTASNIRIPRDVETLIFTVEQAPDEAELNPADNRAELHVRVQQQN